MKKAVILEDNPMGVSNLKNILAQTCHDVEVVAHTGSVREGLQLLGAPECQPDIAFLDIELEDGYVFELLDRLEEINFEVIFVTAYSQYTQRACAYGCIGYIEKPINPDALKMAVERIRPGKKYWNRKRVEVFESHFLQHPNPARHIIIATTTGWHFLRIADVTYLQGEGNSTWFFLKNKRKIFVCRTLGDYDDLLTPLHFYRIHKSYLINLTEVEFFNNRESFVRMRSGDQLDVSRRRRPYFLAVLKKWMEMLGRSMDDFGVAEE